MPRPRKDAAIKRLAGTDRPGRDRVYSGGSDYPAPPVTLTADELPFYRAICKHLALHSAILPIDAFTIAQAAQVAHLNQWAYSEMRKTGAVQQFETGSRQISPEFTVWKATREAWAALAKELGLTVKARVLMPDIFAQEPEDEPDPIADLLNM